MMNTARPHRCDSRGMTLIELLVVIAIIAILAGMTVVALRGINTMKKRAQCQTNMKFFASACTSFSFDSGAGSYPSGGIGDSETDDYTRVNSMVMTQLGMYDVTEKVATCSTIGEQDWLFDETPAQPEEPTDPVPDPDPDADPDADPEMEEPTMAFQMGIVYWLGRGDILDEESGEVVYESRNDRDSYLQLSSSTLATCLCYDGHGQSSGTGSVLPHVGTGFVRSTPDQADPWADGGDYPDGIVIARINGNADWYPYDPDRLNVVNQNGTVLLFTRD